jgi:hypothetical protein
MTSPTCLFALLLAAGIVAAAAPRLGWRLRPAGATARMLRAATAALTGSLAVALALSLVGVNGGAVAVSPALQIGILASIAIAGFLIWRSQGSRAETL